MLGVSVSCEFVGVCIECWEFVLVVSIIYIYIYVHVNLIKLY